MTYVLVKGEDPVLRQVAEPVTAGSSEVAIRDLIENMHAIVKYNKALGLAAPQIGVSLRIIVVRAGRNPITLINPKVLRTWGGKTSISEGCLSYPGFNRHVPRDKCVQIGYEDLIGDVHKRKFKKLEAIAVQHEIDHLNGITIRYPKGLK
jgi:peptide deformylase